MSDPSAPSPPLFPDTKLEPGISAALYRISSMVGAVDTPAAAVKHIVDELVQVFRADAATLALVDPDTGSLVVECSRGYPAEHRDAPIPPGVGLLGWSALHARPVLAADVRQESRYLPLRAATRAQMVAPLEVDGQLHGVIGLESDHENTYAAAHLDMLVQLTRESASVLRRLWTIEHLQRKAGQLEVLGTVAQEIAGKLQPEELMDIVTRESHRLAHCRLATLVLFDAGRRRVRLQAMHPDGDHFASRERDWPIEDCLAGAAITTRKQVERSNLRRDQTFEVVDIPIHVPVVSVLATPLLAEDEVIGVLTIFTEQPRRFDNDERRLMRALANLAAVALQNARLYQRVFESEEHLRNSERLTTLGLLAAEIAHETRNPLTVIRLLFGALNLQFPADDPRATDVAIIREKLDQLETFVTRVLNVGKAPESLHARIALDDIIRETCVLLRLKLSQARIHMDYEPPAQPVVVDCHKGQIQQVLLNVILNATHAMPDGGSITITCNREAVDHHDAVHIDIRDTGPGIKVELLDRIFDSFLSGRPGGTGLGLADRQAHHAQPPRRHHCRHDRTSRHRDAADPAGRVMKTGAVLEVRGLVVRRDHPILRGLDWSVRRGEHWVILGPNGCGKTSLLAALTGYLTPTAGAVNVLGATYGRTDWRELRKHVGFVSNALTRQIEPDEPALHVVASGPAAALNLWRPPTPARRAAARSLLRTWRCAGLADRPWGVMSQGERQRALIARALLARPPLLLLDEPCAGLDPVARAQLLALIERQTQSSGPAVVLITHHVEEITPGFTHVLLMRAGSVVAAGPLETTLKTTNLARAFGVPLRLHRRRERWQLELEPVPTT